jgi:hypothetical protein
MPGDASVQGKLPTYQESTAHRAVEYSEHGASGSREMPGTGASLGLAAT